MAPNAAGQLYFSSFDVHFLLMQMYSTRDYIPALTLRNVLLFLYIEYI
jgi:hypothetical protein